MGQRGWDSGSCCRCGFSRAPLSLIWASSSLTTVQTPAFTVRRLPEDTGRGPRGAVGVC